MMLLAASLLALALAGDMQVEVVLAQDSPVRLDKVKVLNTDAAPLVLLYEAHNVTDAELDQFTVMVFVFDRTGRLKARQVAPGRRTLEARSSKFSTMVLDVGTIEPTDMLMAGVDQAQRTASDQWWRADLRALAEAAAKKRAGPQDRVVR